MADGAQVLLVEDDAAVRMGAEQAIQLAGYSVRSFAAAPPILDYVAGSPAQVVVTDVLLPGMSGLDLMQRLAARDPRLPVILITGHGDIAMAVEAMKQGAYDFLTKPFSSQQLVSTIRAAIEERCPEPAASRPEEGPEAALLGESPALCEVRRLVRAFADLPVDVLIRGEAGTGKERVARALHLGGRRREGRFVTVQCGGLPAHLCESEIFGHEAGAVAGATGRRTGRIEQAEGGTLFLDGIESLPPGVQVRLLRALEEERGERLGSNEAYPVDCRVVASTTEPLDALSRAGRFREDLHWRLDVATIDLPPLRERRGDIPLLFETFVADAARRYRRPAPPLTRALMRALLAHHWPGNVRELHSLASRFVLGLALPALNGLHTGTLSLPEQVGRFERCLIEDELRRQDGCVNAASEALGIPSKTLYDKLRRFTKTGGGR